MLPDWLPWLLQVNDSAFPSGAYAHSLGLEELVQAAVVRTPEELERFLNMQVMPSLLAFEVPVLAIINEVYFRNTQKQPDFHEGRKRLTTKIAQLQTDGLQALKIADYGTRRHFGKVWHEELELRCLPVEAAACAFAQQTLAGYATAAMKLMRLGQEKCQGIIRRSALSLAPQLAAACAVPLEEAGWFNPLLEIASMRHARAAERLFIS